MWKKKKRIMIHSKCGHFCDRLYTVGFSSLYPVWSSYPGGSQYPGSLKSLGTTKREVMLNVPSPYPVWNQKRAFGMGYGDLNPTVEILELWNFWKIFEKKKVKKIAKAEKVANIWEYRKKKMRMFWKKIMKEKFYEKYEVVWFGMRKSDPSRNHLEWTCA